MSYSTLLYYLQRAAVLSLVLVKGRSNNTTLFGPCQPGKSFNANVTTLTKKASILGRRVYCIDGKADIFPCNNVNLGSYLSVQDLNGGRPAYANDNWGWTSKSERRQFALVGLSEGTSFVEITDPVNPKVLGKLPTHTSHSMWRDIKTYKDHAYIVAEAESHGMQVFDLRQLLSTSNHTYNFFSSTYHYPGLSNAHNLFINEDSGYAYAVGSNTCNGGFHIMNITIPANPTFAGCYSDLGYIHDVQCIMYDGPHLKYSGKEICFASKENGLDIIDVSNKEAPELISNFSYLGRGYTHQGWLTEDRNYFLIDDEMDEYKTSKNTHTFICNVRDLENPTLIGTYTSESRAIDHNQYVNGNFVYQANYRAGLRILKLDDVDEGKLSEVGYFDTFPNDDNNEFSGAWSTYPFFDAGVAIISDIEKGLFVVLPDLQLLSAQSSLANVYDVTSWNQSNVKGKESSVEVMRVNTTNTTK